MPQSQSTILIVDDDHNILEVLETRLSAAGFAVHKANEGKTALAILDRESVDLVVSDIKMPTMSGQQLFYAIQERQPGLPVIFLTAFGSIPEAVSAVQAGAIDYLTKPFDGKTLVGKIKSCLERSTSSSASLEHPKNITPSGFIWGNSPKMIELRRLVERVATSSVNTLILGESGVGKECIAKAIHEGSVRSQGPFIVIDCGATPPGILESELFGHTRGSFTSAVADKKGLIEAAHGGTLFLDEIGNISAEMQHRLLRFLEERKIRPIGSVEERQIDCRIIAATNADIVADVQAGKFRQDLYYRLRVVTLNIPPLRERGNDIDELTSAFVRQYCQIHNIPPITIPETTMRWLRSMPWPGNVRQLRNALEAGVVLCPSSTLEINDLQISDINPPESKRAEESAGNFSLQESERSAIIRALRATNGIQKHAAALLNISRRSMHDKIKRYEITPKDYK